MLFVKIKIIDNKLSIDFREPFKPRRGRINCSLNDDGKWRWFGTQFTIRPYSLKLSNSMLDGNKLASSKSFKLF